MVSVYERVMGRSLPVRYAQPGEAIDYLPPFMAEVLPAFESFDSVLETASLAQAFGVRLTSLEEVVRRTNSGLVTHR